ncbi:ribosome biogenesis protein YTM1, putative [Plasmodium berghei]|uniref:Ribosome biogenesis protein YTM1, putative n=2 Tax=Plasmodium berghei TaxID=5821 RepID=A0A509AMM5_PLABA|nr:ribosome biogenesis protein YTM1, putative [Plasmodium berghei ANKA]CXI66194.1 ribosome biogenesis protein YTM1, putative [Plasmodium berghei]SCM24015.1 ribosome biogenesis protein YTM1, putative [Plasmodium berghei]SCN26884.1 ribosome biogenesis protein YTM1, putative [Plasmodium berghei]SCO61290.1 ribosome biogenesis protein YTM1, putative [Plasmodium berghei]SCO63305.1 ribosome biogenesis protein YTM1, putative [Plasmodium berghei]|eukprot:XP_034422500.1 ribosome biogenesis protein YTM1, putative [Plasmodium berghei ANKA]
MGKTQGNKKNNKLDKTTNDDMPEDEEIASDEILCSETESSNDSSEHFSKDEENETQIDKEIQIYFTSNISDDKYKIQGNTTYTIPIYFKRIDLSKMVKKLLNINDDDDNYDGSISFDFLINKKILRSSISEFLEENNILSESTIEIEYILCLKKKTSKHIDNISEWISKMIINENILYCSTFEGNILYYDLKSFNKIDEKMISNTPIYSFNVCKYIPKSDDDICNNHFQNMHQSVIGLFNGTMKVCLNEETDKGISLKSEIYLGNNEDMIKCIEFNKSYSLLISGGTDNKINIYDNNHILEELNNNTNSNNKRKIKNIITPKKCIYKEEGVITSLSFLNDNKFLCTSLNSNINIYDTIHTDIVTSYSYNKSILLSDIINDNLFVISDDQSIIKLFDIRCLNQKNVITLNGNKYYFHDKIITSLEANKNELYILSSSHDGFINIYDIRLNRSPIYTIKNENQLKYLSSIWFYNNDQNNSIVSADEKNLVIHQF